jgi:predicted XRE-type DNA-binding protein
MKREPVRSSDNAPARADSRRVTRGSGDIFLDLGVTLTPEDRVKIVIAHEITRVIAEKKYTQVRAAALMGTDQAKVSRIARGLVDGFSAERLVAYLLALGVDVDMNTSDSGNRVGRISLTPKIAAVG